MTSWEDRVQEHLFLLTSPWAWQDAAMHVQLCECQPCFNDESLVAPGNSSPLHCLNRSRHKSKRIWEEEISIEELLSLHCLWACWWGSFPDCWLMWNGPAHCWWCQPWAGWSGVVYECKQSWSWSISSILACSLLQCLPLGACLEPRPWLPLITDCNL